MKPTPEEAHQFAVILHAGVPASDAILYFTEATDPAEIALLLRSWINSKAVAAAMRALEGPPWESLTLDEMFSRAIHQHYAGLAYLLYRKHYAEVGAADQGKLDRARAAIEAKQAGRAGAADPLSQFFDDLKSGRIKLGTKPLGTLAS